MAWFRSKTPSLDDHISKCNSKVRGLNIFLQACFEGDKYSFPFSDAFAKAIELKRDAIKEYRDNLVQDPRFEEFNAAFQILKNGEFAKLECLDILPWFVDGTIRMIGTHLERQIQIRALYPPHTIKADRGEDFYRLLVPYASPEALCDVMKKDDRIIDVMKKSLDITPDSQPSRAVNTVEFQDTETAPNRFGNLGRMGAINYFLIMQKPLWFRIGMALEDRKNWEADLMGSDLSSVRGCLEMLPKKPETLGQIEDVLLLE